ncbi:MAG: (d)CMP kinase [Proteobacteria bacterium]|nr:(d)CMP kinase [Pseudomonadota bacterium]
MKKFLITIDGPAGSGKTTVSKLLAKRLNYKYIDTGALYRGVAFETFSQGIDPELETDLETLCDRIDLKFEITESGLRLFSNGKDISDQIRTPEISMMASRVSAKPCVRGCLLGLQKKMGQEKCAVFEGRDMGTVVFPDADVKFFMMASIKERALRRFREMGPDSSQTLEEVEQDMMKRDANDSNRDIAPLKPAPDAIKIDTTHLDIETVVNKMAQLIEAK